MQPQWMFYCLVVDEFYNPSRKFSSPGIDCRTNWGTLRRSSITNISNMCIITVKPKKSPGPCSGWGWCWRGHKTTTGTRHWVIIIVMDTRLKKCWHGRLWKCNYWRLPPRHAIFNVQPSVMWHIVSSTGDIISLQARAQSTEHRARYCSTSGQQERAGSRGIGGVIVILCETAGLDCQSTVWRWWRGVPLGLVTGLYSSRW